MKQPINSGRALRPFGLRRLALRLSLDQAALRLRVHPRHLQAVERGRVPLTQVLAARMAAEYQTTIDQLMRTG